MRVLYICHRIPYPPDKGEKIRAFHQLRAIAAKHEVDLFTLAFQKEELAHRPALARYCSNITIASLNPVLARMRTLGFLLTRTPLTVPYFYSAELQAAVRQALRVRQYDRIFVLCSAMAQYVEQVTDIPIVMDLVDVDSNKWAQYASFSRFPFSAVYGREGKRLREYERKVCGMSARVLVTTGREAELVRELSGRSQADVVPNGVDTEYFKPAPLSEENAPPAAIFTGDMSYFPNVQAVTFFALQVLPLIRRTHPAARFLIVGRNPNADVRRLAKVEGVEVTGSVPDVRPFLARAQVAVAPFSIAAGIQNKILEALAFGLPVVATPRTIQGLSAGCAGVVDSADSAEGLAAHVARLLSDPKLARLQGLEGRRRVIAEYQWEPILARMLQLVEHPVSEENCKTEAHLPLW